ncbi:hypothetical protein M404DRAFT_1005368 [Pisolithus tinctorius Marx 270]|uniref:Peptidase M20 dimerisation domain-containing protein n=1 Tax=Pisolithus tinctorius Marx 270 TaxID=870435 RepID=A0A0C3NT36_PISTI|nr:hypothetical protein M404DRAFT_1005368 [Pisolithus tinctorius Marx 270]
MSSKATMEILNAPMMSLPEPALVQSHGRCSATRAISLFAAVGVLCLFMNHTTRHCWFNHSHKFDRYDTNALANICPQVPPFLPQKNFDVWESLGTTYDTAAFKAKAVSWLVGVVQVPTESYDYFGPVGTDSHWEKFHAFHAYLQKAFELVHAELELTTVNTYGLIFLWMGSNEGLKPLLLTAHQDAVPMEPTTVDKWIHPPFSGHFDGDWMPLFALHRISCVMHYILCTAHTCVYRTHYFLPKWSAISPSSF